MADTTQENLFSGAAAFYKYRFPYPQTLFVTIRQQLGLDGKGQMLDVGCGPGNVCLGFSADFETIVAVDINGEMLELGRQNAQALGIQNIRWLQQPAEAINPELGRFRLVSFGRSFHWMQREQILAQLWDCLEPGGAIAVIDSHSGRSWWEVVTQGLIQRWRKQERMVQSNTAEGKSHLEIIKASRFTAIEMGEVTEVQTVDIDQILGNIFSTSSAKPELFGENLEAFKSDLRAVLTVLNPSGQFERERKFSYILVRKANG